MTTAVEQFKRIIKERAQHSQRMRREARRYKGKLRNLTHIEIRQYGEDTRFFLLMYAFLRGVEYQRVERKCHPHNAAFAPWLLHMFNWLDFDILPETEYEELPPRLDQIKDWLQKKPQIAAAA